jgi:hypothetical protein
MPDPLSNKDFTADVMHKFAFPSKPSKGKTWLLARLWKKPVDPAEQLSLKAYSIKPEAEEVHKELMKVLSKFSSSDSLYPYVREVVDPLLREINHILHKLQNNLTDDALTRYSQWTEKARRWVHLCSLVDDEKLAQEVNDHIVERSLELIARDINLIMQYRSSSQNSSLDISIYIQELEALKVNPNLPLEQISKWKQKFDSQRQVIVNDCYQAIDQ